MISVDQNMQFQLLFVVILNIPKFACVSLVALDLSSHSEGPTLPSYDLKSLERGIPNLSLGSVSMSKTDPSKD